MIKYFITFTILLSFSISAFASEADSNLSPLDQAYADALEDAQKGLAYYNLLLNSELFIPVHSAEKENPNTTGGTFEPILMKPDGVLFLIVFDSLERLRQWGNDEIAYVSMSGRNLVEAVGSDLHWALNVETDHRKIFVPEELQRLAELVAESKVTEQVIPKDGKIYISNPDNASPDLINAITTTLREFPEVQTAYLAWVAYETDSSKPNLIIAVDSPNISNSRKDELNTAITHAIIGLFAGNKFLDLIYIGNTGTGRKISESVDPIYEASTTSNQLQ